MSWPSEDSWQFQRELGSLPGVMFVPSGFSEGFMSDVCLGMRSLQFFSICSFGSQSVLPRTLHLPGCWQSGETACEEGDVLLYSGHCASAPEGGDCYCRFKSWLAKVKQIPSSGKVLMNQVFLK